MGSMAQWTSQHAYCPSLPNVLGMVSLRFTRLQLQSRDDSTWQKLVKHRQHEFLLQMLEHVEQLAPPPMPPHPPQTPPPLV